MTRRAFVIGHPIAHSRSPLIHGTWISAHGIAGTYEAIDVAPDQLRGFFERLRGGEFVGGNVTIPHKQAALELCDSIDELAARIGAVNTLTIGDGAISGRNTDHDGFLANLDQEAPGWSDAPGPAIVLGAGGASRAVLLALASRGFGPIHILNRTEGAARSLARTLPGPFEGHPLTAFDAIAGTARLLVNTTSVGLHGTAFRDLDPGRLGPGALVTDIVYVPLETPLLALARARGLRTVDGLGMLLHQAVPGFAAWFAVRPSVTAGVRARIAATLVG